MRQTCQTSENTEFASNPHRQGAWQLLAQMLPIADLTAEALAGRLQPAVEPNNHVSTDPGSPYARMARALYRDKRTVTCW